jgi:hypothetical protein
MLWEHIKAGTDFAALSGHPASYGSLRKDCQMKYGQKLAGFDRFGQRFFDKKGFTQNLFYVIETWEKLHYFEMNGI